MKPMLKVEWISIAVATAFSGSAMAAGFALQNQNGSGNGNAFAGAAAAAEDAGTIFFNPAGMAYLPQGNNVSIAATILNRSIKATDSGTSPATLNPGVTSTNGGDAGGTSVIPAAYWAKSMSSDVSIGFGLSPTFGNTTEYSNDFFGRYSGYYAELKQINLNPSLSYKVAPKLALGFGLNYATSDITFKQVAPIAAITGAVAAAAPPLASQIQRPDSDVTLSGDGTAVGYNLGFMFELDDATRLAMAYRSKMKFDLEGTQTAANAPTFALSTIAALGGPTSPGGGGLLAVQAGLPASVGISAVLETPDSLSLAISNQLSAQWELLGDLTWTGWSSVNKINVTRADGIPHPGLTYNFKDSYRIGLGANYRLDDSWKLRFGVAHDKTPVRGPADTTMTLPDSDRTWLSFGAKVAINGNSSIDVGYTHIFFDDASTVREVRTSTGTLLQTIRGNFETSADLLSLQYNANF